MHLPKDLPEAYERAIESISDHQYNGSVMKLVMAGMEPLSLDEIRVALSIRPGDNKWDREKIPRDGAQLISLCGGNLLGIDEEDNKVRFIHHSVIPHLLSPATRPSTKLYHFTLEDAQNHMGSTCVSDLNLPIHDTRITNSRNLKGGDVLKNVIRSTDEFHPTISRLVQHIQSRNQKRGISAQIDVGRIIAELRAAEVEQNLDPLCFLDYAKEHWIAHTGLFDEAIPECKHTWKLWWHLLCGGVAAIPPPCPDIVGDPISALLWTVEQGHQALFRVLITENSLRQGVRTEQLFRSLEQHRSIHDRWLGDVLAQYLEIGPLIPIYYRLESTLELLLNLGADPGIPHHVSGSMPVLMLIAIIAKSFSSIESDLRFIQRIFSYPAIQFHLTDLDVLRAIEEHLSADKPEAATEILSHCPDSRIPRRELSWENDPPAPPPHRPARAVQYDEYVYYQGTWWDNPFKV